ncbi:hypothetical protein [Butyrivibrio sp. LC3010]|uniref:hypothetical protein n=1 Tax=Butyrivibrio sp. LC3010 TaxID=1280680 RepID=UPI0003FDF8C8|nr:hypothetical protein [Butyrivibrio sp. LC3010]
MICSLCGKDNKNEAEKCIDCGFELDKAFTRRVAVNKAVLKSIQEEVMKYRCAIDNLVDRAVQQSTGYSGFNNMI